MCSLTLDLTVALRQTGDHLRSMGRAVSIYWIHVYVSFLLDCRHLHLSFKKAIFLNTLSDPWSSEYSNYDERAEGWEAIFSLEIICYLRLIFVIFVCVCVFQISGLWGWSSTCWCVESLPSRKPTTARLWSWFWTVVTPFLNMCLTSAESE